MDAGQAQARLRTAHRPLGAETLALMLGEESLRIEGLSAELADDLERRWGCFVRPDRVGSPANSLRVLTAGPGGWLEASGRGGPYRLRAVADRTVVSDHFALGREGESGPWKLGLSEAGTEPLERILDNAARIVLADRALARGGFALHAAGVLHEGRAFLLAGPSRAGKSTAARLAQPAASLGDDFGFVLRDGADWVTAALPFDNRERIDHLPPDGSFPVAGILRVHQAGSTRIETPAAAIAVASLMSCTAFPWIFQDRAATLLANVQQFVEAGRFAHLHFTRDASLLDVLSSC